MPANRPERGRRVVASGLLSRETTYSFEITGPLDVKEAERLVQIAELLRDWIREDESRAEVEMTT